MAASFCFTGEDPDTLVFFAGLGVNSASSCCNTLTKKGFWERMDDFSFYLRLPPKHWKIRLHYSVQIRPLRQWFISQCWWSITITSNMPAINSCFSLTVTGDYKAFWDKITKKHTSKLYYVRLQLILPKVIFPNEHVFFLKPCTLQKTYRNKHTYLSFCFTWTFSLL